MPRDQEARKGASGADSNLEALASTRNPLWPSDRRMHAPLAECVKVLEGAAGVITVNQAGASGGA
jgi:hypothetical protein